MTEQRLLPHVVVNTQDVKLLFLFWSNCLQPVGSVGAVNPCLESFYTVSMAYICMAAISECNTSSRRNWTWWPGLLSVPLFSQCFALQVTRGHAGNSHTPRSDVSRSDFDDVPRLLLCNQFCFDVPSPRRRSVLERCRWRFFKRLSGAVQRTEAEVQHHCGVLLAL